MIWGRNAWSAGDKFCQLVALDKHWYRLVALEGSRQPAQLLLLKELQNQILIENDDENDDDNGDNFDVWWWQCPKIFNYHDFVVKIYPF